MSDTTNHIPPGYWQDGQGNMIPDSKVKQIDKLRDELVRNLTARAKAQSEALTEFKRAVMAEVDAFMALSQAEYGITLGREKGNVTLSSYNMSFKIVRAMQAKIAFGEQLVAAKTLIDECVHEWAKDANDNIKAMVNHAFQTDREGKINTDRVLGLRSLDIQDEKWQRAMQAIADSIKTVGTKPYIRFYERNPKTLDYVAITLDVAGA